MSQYGTLRRTGRRLQHNTTVFKLRELEELDELKMKKRRLNFEIVSLTESGNEWPDKVESDWDLNFICKSYFLRKSAKQKI